jgi:hypothetical protein
MEKGLMRWFQIARALAVLMLFATTTLPSHNASAQEPTQPQSANAIWIEPSLVELDFTQIPVGYKFNVTVWANCSVPCGAWQVWLLYEEVYLNATRAGYTGPDGLKSDFFQNITSVSVRTLLRSHNATHSRVECGESWTGSGDFRNPGYGSLCWIEFNVTLLPTVPLDTTLSFYAYAGDSVRTYLIDGTTNQKVDLNTCTCLVKFARTQFTLTITATSGGTTNPHLGTRIYDEGAVVTVQAFPNYGFQLGHWELDSVSIGAPNPVNVTMDTNHTLRAVFSYVSPLGTRIFVDPMEIMDPTMVPGSEFSINITVDDVGDLKTCMFNVSYDPSIIGWIGMRLYKIQGAYPSPITIADDQAGFIWIQLECQMGVTSMDPIALVRLDCHVDCLGSTPLDLHDTHLLDTAGVEIDHNVTDGFFTSTIRDVAITNVTTGRNWAYVGWSVPIAVSVENKGNVNETFTIQVYYEMVLLANLTVTDLMPDEEQTILVRWDTTALMPYRDYVLSANIPPIPYEYNTTDNQFTDGAVRLRIFGDVTGDGYVGIDDIYATAQAFGSSPSHPRWNEYADLNQDEYIGIDDMYAVAGHFGAESP